jgi:hypothetical protein
MGDAAAADKSDPQHSSDMLGLLAHAPALSMLLLRL